MREADEAEVPRSPLSTFFPEAWEPCDITQKHAGLAAFLQFSERLNWKIMEMENDFLHL
jgi:hypothetical protein